MIPVPPTTSSPTLAASPLMPVDRILITGQALAVASEQLVCAARRLPRRSGDKLLATAARLRMEQEKLSADLGIIYREPQATPAAIPSGWTRIEWCMPQRCCPECGGVEISSMKTEARGGRTWRKFECRGCGNQFQTERRELNETNRQALANDTLTENEPGDGDE